MIKKELIKEVASRLDVTERESTDFINTFLNVVTEKVADGDEVKLVGFGSFGSKLRSARQGVNPKTGESLQIPAKNVPYFKPGKQFKDLVNE